MTDDELLWLDATGQAELVRSGEIAPEELVSLSIDKLERVDEQLAVLVHRRFEAARREAIDIDRTAALAGVPMVLKDLIAHGAGEPFHESVAGVAARGYVARDDTELVRRFRTAGLVIVGKSKSSELGILPLAEPVMYPPVRNPWDPERATMGSSGGSAAAVAAGAVAVGHGNDLGGSLRQPASACGVVGFKPSRGRVPLGSDFGDLMAGMVVELAMTRSVRDIAALLDAVAGTTPADPYDVSGPADFVAGLADHGTPIRVGLLTTATDPACTAAVEDAGRTLESFGHQVEYSHPAALEEAELGRHLFGVISAYAEYALAWWQRELGEPLSPEDVEPFTWWLAERSRTRTPGDWLSTVEWLQAWSRRAADWFKGHDVLVTPTMNKPPPPLGTIAYDPADPTAVLRDVAVQAPHTMAWNVTGSPAISLPLGMAGHLPVGVQLVAPRGGDRPLLALSAQLEQATPWAGRRPPDW